MRTGHIRRFGGVLASGSVVALAAAAMLGLGMAPAMAATGAPDGAAVRSAPDTIACAGACFSLYSRQVGPGVTMNAYIPGDTGSGGKVGRKINLHPASDFRPNGDFVPDMVGQVFQMCGTAKGDFFRPSSYICTNDGSYWVFETQWAPQGSTTDLCVGVGVAGRAGENVTLRTCGVSTSTLWVIDDAHSFGGNCRVPGNFCPWMSATDPDFKTPLVLTVDTSTKSPRYQLKLGAESLLGDGHAIGSQEFAFYWGSVR